jgi:peptidoglycan/LPS O-acetylase OafA/YrhL
MVLWTAAELAVVAAIAMFVTLAAGNPASLAAPLLFALALGVFARERGFVSQLLKLRLFLWLGMLSYGIYMVHIFVQARMINGATLIGKLTGTDLIGTFHIGEEAFYGFGTHGGWFGTLMLAVMILLVVATAWLGNVLVEKPFQRWSRRLAADPAAPLQRQAARFARLRPNSKAV